MAKREDYELKTERLLEPIIQENRFELVDVEYVKEGGNWFLRAYIDKEGGITIEDCEKVNRALSDLMDANDFIEESYILEVSSPGLGRQLKKDKDFIRSMGQDVEVKLFQSIEVTEKNKVFKVKEFYGALVAFDQETITLRFDDNEELELQRKNIAMIRLAIDF